MTIEIQKVGVIGCGLMGSGIAQVAAQSGRQVQVHEVDAARLKEGLERIEAFLAKGVERGNLTATEQQAILTRIQGSVELEDLKDADLIIEAVVEDIETKTSLYRALEKRLDREAILVSNTSSLCITELAASTQRPDRFAGLHFFNPVPLMKVVEVIPTLSTAPQVVETLKEFVASLGKRPIEAPDRPGFIVNRLLVPYLLDAVRALEEGVASREDIDAGMKLGAGHPMGPLELLDFVGLDTTLFVADIMYDEFKERRFAPPPLLRRLVMAGHLGRKSGKGFYDYE